MRSYIHSVPFFLHESLFSSTIERIVSVILKGEIIMQSFEFTPQGVCARKITFDLEDGLIHHLHFEGGCPGNLAAIGKLLEGRSAKEAADILLGNTCRDKQTSCADQLAHALIEAMKKEN